MNISKLLSLPELRRDLLRVDDALKFAVSGDDPFLTEVASHLIRAGGKRLRPSLAIAAAMTGSDAAEVSDDVIQAAVSVELVHIGSLYHDDVLDEATTRRTVPSVNAQYGNFMAVLAGDYLLARSSSIASGLGTEITKLLADTIAELCAGQVYEFQHNFDLGRTVEAYEKSIAGKTASLLDTAARMGGMTAGLSEPQIDALGIFAHSFGMAFQIRDDILDVVGTDAQLGKPAGNDLVEGVYTLPVIFALEEDGAGSELRDLLGGPIDTETRDRAREIIRHSNGVPRAIEVGRTWAADGAEALSVLPDTPMRAELVELATSVFDEF